VALTLVEGLREDIRKDSRPVSSGTDDGFHVARKALRRLKTFIETQVKGGERRIRHSPR